MAPCNKLSGHPLTNSPMPLAGARRRIMLGAADWALSPAGLEVLRGRAEGNEPKRRA